MPQFDKLVLTDKGRDLRAKAETGVTLQFTRMAVGDGELNGQELKELESLISERASLDIVSMNVIGNGTSRVRAAIDNHDLESGYYVREIGLFAQDPDVGEILYSVANAGDKADYMPAYSGSEIVESIIDLITVVGDAQEVTAVIDESLVYVTVRDLLEQEKVYLNDPDTGQRIAFGLSNNRLYYEEVTE